MPTYAYRCKDCGPAFDVVQAFTDDALTECPAAAEAGDDVEDVEDPAAESEVDPPAEPVPERESVR